MPIGFAASNNYILSQVPEGMQEFLATIYINEQNTGDVVYVLQDFSNNLYINQHHLKDWNIQLANHPPLMFEDQAFYNLQWYPGITHHYDELTQTFYLNIPSKYFTEQTYNKNDLQYEALRPSHPGGFINYDATLIGENFVGNSTVASNNFFGSIAELNYFNQWGIGRSDFLLQNTPDAHKFVRLETTWTLDQPEKISSWRLGDSTTGVDSWTGAARFGGIQYATNFATQPGFVTFPMPSYKGEAVVPSNVNFFLNSQLLLEQQVNSGPFQIDDLPAVTTGAGDLVVVTKDILGRSTTVVIPYYVNQELLAPGIADFSYEAGFIRDNYGLDSNDYGRFTTVGTYRKGITDKMTLGWHGELLRDQQTLGASGEYLVNDFAVLSTAAAVSHSKFGKGGLMLLGISRQTQTISAGIQAIGTTRDFAQIGILQDEDDYNNHQLSPALTGQAFASYTHPWFGTLSTTYTQRNGRTEGNLGIATASYSRNIFKEFFFIINVVKDVTNNTDNQVYASLVWSPAANYTASANVFHQNGESFPALSFTKNLPAGNGYGYRLLAEKNGSGNQGMAADYSLQTSYGTYNARYAHVDKQGNYEVDASGSVVFFANDVFLARHVDQSFAVVQVPGVEGVSVYDSHQLIATTNDKGNVFIPNTLAYQPNFISIDARDIPLDYQIETLEQEAIPYFRSGVLVEFPVQKVRNYIFKLVDEKNNFIPPGATIYYENNLAEGLVGYDGEVFIATPIDKPFLKGKVEIKDHYCYFNIPVPSSEEIMNDLGKATCYVK